MIGLTKKLHDDVTAIYNGFNFKLAQQLIYDFAMTSYRHFIVQFRKTFYVATRLIQVDAVIFNIVFGRS